MKYMYQGKTDDCLNIFCALFAASTSSINFICCFLLFCFFGVCNLVFSVCQFAIYNIAIHSQRSSSSFCNTIYTYI